MLRRALLASIVLLAAVAGWAGVGLWRAHRAIGALHPPLPGAAQILEPASRLDLPVRIWVLNTASQPMPRAAVLEASLDPAPDLPYVMSFPAFAVEWSDGRLFLIDLGMDEVAALAFGRPAQLAIGAEPIRPLLPVASQLGTATASVAAIGVTHLHGDHTQGIEALCRVAHQPIPLLQSQLQAEEWNYTTAGPARQLLQAPCVDSVVLPGEGLLAIPGFPGLLVLPVSGHTPGSQIFVAHVQGEEGVATWILIGDVANHLDGILHDVPKPAYYSRFIVPENAERLQTVRRFLRELARDERVGLLVSHDQLQLEGTGLPLRWHRAQPRSGLESGGTRARLWPARRAPVARPLSEKR